MLTGGSRYGTHRVLEPKGTLSQPALKLDNTMEIYENKILIDVKTLNVDSASYTQIKQFCGADPERMEELILSIVQERGKLQNPVTGSGGMLIGTVKEIGPKFQNTQNLKVGDKIATLVSLSLTPLKINKILNISPDSEQVDVDAQAILFESGLFAVLPDDIPEKLALAALDVAGATNVMDVYHKVMAITGGRGCDVTVNNVNVPSTKMTSILVTKGRGSVYFFSMATSFTKAALGAEGVGKDINLIVGNGFAKGHANLTLNIIRESEPIRELFEKLYV